MGVCLLRLALTGSEYLPGGGQRLELDSPILQGGALGPILCLYPPFHVWGGCSASWGLANMCLALLVAGITLFQQSMYGI